MIIYDRTASASRPSNLISQKQISCLEMSTRYIDMTSRQIKIARISVSLIATLTAPLHSVGAWENIQYGVKSRPNNRNMSKQHIATLLGATCVRLQLRRVMCFWLKCEGGLVWANNSRSRVAKRARHVAPKNVVIWCVAIVFRGFTSNNCTRFLPL